MKMQVTCARVAVVMLSLAAGACGAADEESQGGLHLGISASGEATAADAGLPSYPGSKPYKESEQSSSAANLGFSIPGFGLKVVAMNLETPDRPERVAAFYRRALSKYGKVLDCSDAEENKKKSKPRSEDSDELVCDADDPGANSVVYKVGSEANHRIVAIKPHGSGTRFALVHVDTRDKSKR
jgi:hypothetical protein